MKIGTHRTNVRIFALIDILTVVGNSVSSLSWWTLAGEGTDGVDTTTTLTESWHCCTFVYILGKKKILLQTAQMITFLKIIVFLCT